MTTTKKEVYSRQYAVGSRKYTIASVYCLLLTVYCLLAGYAFANPLDLTKPPSSSTQLQAFSPRKLKIGCILPLSGKNVSTGQRVLEGIQLAFNTFSTPNDELNLIVRDSENEVSVTNLLEDLARNEDVIAVIGPLFSKSVIASARIADKYKIPVFSPTASLSNISNISPHIFRNSLTNQLQGEALAEYAFNYLNLKIFAILYQKESYAIELKNAFEDKLKYLGGEILFSEPFDSEQNDFEQQITAIGGIKDSDLKKIIESGELRPPLTYEAIFIQGTAERVGLILPELAYYNISDIPVLGSNGLNSPDFIRIGGKYAEGVIFIDGFYINSEKAEVRKFVERYRIFYNKEPDMISAQSYDAAGIILNIIKNGARSREDVKNGLLNLKEYNGVSGITTIKPSGDSDKSLYFLTVKNGKIVEVNR
jgi:ABC-type branched-subunit amino acid transport system substrate-binding protein